MAYRQPYWFCTVTDSPQFKWITISNFSKSLLKRDMIIQIIHINDNHWTTVDCEEGTVKVYIQLSFFQNN